MSKQDFVLNTHLFPNVNENGQLLSNTKAGWQSSKVAAGTQSNIKATIAQVAAWIADGTIKDGDIITTHTQVTFTSDAAPMPQAELLVNGKAVKPAAPAPADDDVPF